MDLYLKRKHPILAAREVQIARNVAAAAGGRDYIDMRLWRAPNESDLSWIGSNAVRGAVPGCVGRLQRACCLNDAGRVVSKIDQYLFQASAKRPGMDEEWAASVDGAGRSVNGFWEDVSSSLTTGQWCWLQADRIGGDEEGRTLADKAARGDVVRWRLWPSLSVPDWSLDERGEIRWLITSETTWDDIDPAKPAVRMETRTLWRRGEDGGTATWETWRRGGQDNDEAVCVGSGSVSSRRVPFVLVGKPSASPWWYDDVELIQAQTLNLDSLHVENLVRTVFPQLVVSANMVGDISAKLVERTGERDGEHVLELVKEIVRGLDAPLVESPDDKGVSRFLQPNATDLQAIPTEIMRKRQVLFDQVGLSLFNRESRQIQSAESKQFDHLDTAATLRNRALILQDAEEALVAVSKEIDTSFADYVPEWPVEFDVTDVEAESAALSTLQSLSHLTLTQRKVMLRAATKILDKINRVSEEERTAIDKEIDELKDEEFSFPAARFEEDDGEDRAEDNES